MELVQISPQEAEQWIDGLSAFDRDNETVILAICAAFGVPKSYLDVGSGDGAMVNVMEKLGVEVNGLDQLPRPNHPKLLQVDLRQPIYLYRDSTGRKELDIVKVFSESFRPKYPFDEEQYDLVTSIETAEHIEPEFADVYVDTVTRHAAHRIVFTAAMPGQQGHGHVNTQPATYWRKKFYERGFDYSSDNTARLAAILALSNHSSHHIEANLQVFLK